MSMHAAMGGVGPGRKYNVEVLNKSAILFACAGFEAFVEELAERSFNHIVANSKSHNSLPKSLLKSIAEILKKDKDELKVWELAGDGWRVISEQYKDQILEKYTGSFNTPKPHNIEGLLKELIGFKVQSTVWQWQGMKAEYSKEKLKSFIELRGALAHGEKPPVLKKMSLITLLF